MYMSVKSNRSALPLPVRRALGQLGGNLALARRRHIVAVRAQSPSLNGVIIFGSKFDGMNASALNGISCAKVERVAESKGAPNALSVGNLHPPSIAYDAARIVSFLISSSCSSRQARGLRMCRPSAIHPQENGRPWSAPRPCLQWTRQRWPVRSFGVAGLS